MNLLHPWALILGTVAVALPFAIHWLTKPRPRRVPLSTIRFVQEVVQHRRARHRLRDWIILFLRTCAVILLACAFARPLIGARPLIAAGDSSNAARIVILDQSQSMGAVTRGVTPFERARSVAANFLAYQPGLAGNLILASAGPRGTFDRLSENFGAMREDLAKAQVKPEQLNLQAAIAAAGDMLAQIPPADPRRRELIIVSDFQRSNWSSADFSPLPKETVIQLESVATAQPAPNIGILRIGTQGRLEQGRNIRIEVEVGNFSPTPQNVQVEVSIADRSYRLSGLCPPRVKTTLTSEIPLPAAGWQNGTARLINSDDGLMADNSRSFVLDVHPTPAYGLITRDSSKPQPTSSHFLERALAPIKPREGRAVERVVRLDPSQIDRESLSGMTLIVLDHPGKLPQASIDLLAALLRRGRGILYIASEPSDATNLNLLSAAAGTNLRMPVEFVPPPAGQSRRDLFLTEWRAKEAPFAAFGEDLAAAMAPLRFSGGLSSRRLEAGLVDDVLASYSDRSAAMVVTVCGAGTLAVFNADLNQSNLASSGVFVPLMEELVGRLLSQIRADDAAASGEPLAVYLPAEAGVAEGLKISSLENASDEMPLGSFTEETGLLMWRWNATGRPGIYTVKRDTTTVFAIATGIPAAESDLQPIDSSLLKTRLAGGRTVGFQSTSDPTELKDSIWSWFVVACAICMLLELTVLKMFRT